MAKNHTKQVWPEPERSIWVSNRTNGQRFVIRPIHLHKAENFALLSDVVGGLVRVSDSMQVLQKSRSRLRHLLAEGRFTVMRFSFGDFISLRELREFSPMAPHRPKIFIACKSSSGNGARNNSSKYKKAKK